MNTRRIRALLRKEWLDLIRNPGALAPVLIVSLVALVLPFVVAVGIPAWSGEALSDDPDLARVSVQIGAPLSLRPDAQVQYFLLQQFLLLFLLTPITGAMALAAHSIVGEKQARTLEPLLATPLTTGELLVAKVFGAMWPSLAVSLFSIAMYFAGIVWLAQPGVAAAMANGRTALLVLVIAPAAALVGLQAALIVSSRVNDPRTAQQVGVLLIVPVTVVLVAQFTGALWLSGLWLLMTGAGLVVLWVVLLGVSVWLFRREAILTRWR
ncbi:MAG: ABC transporter permease subunit [Vicinamibacterales bacterium]